MEYCGSTLQSRPRHTLYLELRLRRRRFCPRPAVHA
jgi:hypothetical protein